MILRDAVLKDADWTIELRNNNESMHFSNTNRQVTPEEHRQWFSKFLKNKQCALYIVEDNGEHIGVVRFEIKEKNMAVVSIDIASKFRGKGFALKVLNNALEKHYALFNCNHYLAYIYPFNLRSIRLFEKAQFNLINDKNSPNEYLKVMAPL